MKLLFEKIYLHVQSMMQNTQQRSPFRMKWFAGWKNKIEIVQSIKSASCIQSNKIQFQKYVFHSFVRSYLCIISNIKYHGGPAICVSVEQQTKWQRPSCMLFFFSFVFSFFNFITYEVW